MDGDERRSEDWAEMGHEEKGEAVRKAVKELRSWREKNGVAR